jgi:uncharacterized protein (DUF305 family)
MKHARRALLLPLLLALLGALAACAGDASTNGRASYNQTDVTFATELIPHHRQSLQMVRMVEQRDVDPKLKSFAAQLRVTKAVEIESMLSWLKDWDVTAPTGDPSVGTGQSGAVNPGDLAALEGSTGNEFEKQWLRLMIRQHEDAIALAKVENAKGQYPYAVALANTVMVGQASQIRTMELMLG